MLDRGCISKKSYQDAIRSSSRSSLPPMTARNSSPASQAEPMISPSRFSSMRDLGMMGKRLKCSRWALDTSLYRLRRPVWFFASRIRW